MREEEKEEDEKETVSAYEGILSGVVFAEREMCSETSREPGTPNWLSALRRTCGRSVGRSVGRSLDLLMETNACIDAMAMAMEKRRQAAARGIVKPIGARFWRRRRGNLKETRLPSRVLGVMVGRVA